MPEDQKRNESRTPYQIIADITRDLSLFNESFREQAHVQIPKGVLRKVDDYRNEFFPYLKDSIYKSNLCYFLQLIDYQLWQYKVFKPTLSLGNALFYQLSITLGMVVELLVYAILVDPFVETDNKDRSLGIIKRHFKFLGKIAANATFYDNIKLLHKLNLLGNNEIEKFHEFRIYVRNMVHVQNWESRIYETYTKENFQSHYNLFRNLLREFTKKGNLNLQPEQLLEALGLLFPNEDEILCGKIKKYQSVKKYGFIENEKLPGRTLYFRLEDGHELQNTIQEGKNYSYRVTLSGFEKEKEKEAYDLKPLPY